ncbi:hypothetical protein CCQ97_18230 [Salmonella enterica]|uniref:ClpX-type ZB domain-containing protein n=1 Tax=Salmonella enterica TaxID=28901 RepID=A0A5U3UBC4_SALER|nr:hypothetical protein [Salmonella enterica]EBB0359164.1 hypothetical protein [Salmonella enterica subsp. enterica serovar Rubislaw]EDP8873019.1 hypothetical protein [Salmonella enterica subsp. enterica]EDX4410900.1 hypothetical protein [Salmonella enterica subsp. houtenae serovar 44:z36,[z38]:-]ELF2054656.1 hypothetical protein [Salmonella enterica subsp. enterica serovar Gaminara]
MKEECCFCGLTMDKFKFSYVLSKKTNAIICEGCIMQIFALKYKEAVMNGVVESVDWEKLSNETHHHKE